DAAGGELVARGIRVVDHQHQRRTCRAGDTEPGAEGDRAGGPVRCALHEADLVVRALVVVGIETDLVDVELLGPVDITDGEKGDLELVIHGVTVATGCRYTLGN